MDNSNNNNSEAYSFATQLATAAAIPAALKCAVELDLLELIKKAGPGAYVSPAELAAQITTTNPAAHAMLDRILRLLAAHSILNCRFERLPGGGAERLYSLAPVCEFFTKNEDGVSLAPLFLLSQDKVEKGSSDKLKDAFLDGGVPFNKAYGMSAFEYAGKNMRFNKVFNEAMSNHSTIVMKKVLETYNGFEGIKSVVDVGGGTGATLDMIVSKYPWIEGINLDLPHVIQHVPSHLGVKHIAGDMFVGVPKGDAIFMKWICHNWSDEHCLNLLRNCYEAIPGNGKVILVESILPETPDENGLATKSIYQFDMSMMTHIAGGKERTETEFHALAKGAGFKQFLKVCCAYHFWIMELMK